MPNRLAGETSPYLLQHKDNPVDWYPWGEEAFAKAKTENKPVFLSVGYSSCHWCHVMEHESFEDEAVAEVLNRDFVSVKVDREERPDVDEAYMTAVQLSSGRGGWPMTVFMTPDRKPFFCGTYFPKDDRQGHPGFLTIVQNIGNAWKTRHGELLEAAEEFSAHLRQALDREAPKTFTQLSADLLKQAVALQAGDFDQQNGGFGDKPKFPPHTALEFLMAYALRPDAEQQLRDLSVAMSLITMEKMCLGGIHDHVGGGFHRYSTDERWLLPHFEKMLYDNALMLGNLTWGTRIAYHLDQRLATLYLRSAEALVEWLEREMRSPEGLFYSALDADTEGEEGKFYVWTEDEVRIALGEDATGFLEAYNFKAEGNFHDEATSELTGKNIPHLSEDPGPAFQEELALLLAEREKRTRPGLDNKVLVAWNGMTIAALADVGAVDLAETAATELLRIEGELGRLPHQVAGGKASGKAYLDDYAFFIFGLLKLAEVSDPEGHDHTAAENIDQNSPWFEAAKRLCETMVRDFYDEEKGGFYYTSEAHEELFGRTKPVFDQPIPSGNAVAVRCLVRLGDLTRARKTVESCIGWMERAPQATEALYLAAMELIDAGGMELSTAPAAEPEPVRTAMAPVVATVATRELVAEDGWGRTEVVLDIPEGVHINTSEPPARWLIPTTVTVQPLEAEVDYPTGADYGYDGRTTIPVRVKLPPGKSEAEFEIRVRYQPCTETECLEPIERAFDCVVLRG